MSYIVLARKWRPKRFAEMVGQEHVLQALTNSLDSGKIHHAFLFTGHTRRGQDHRRAHSCQIAQLRDAA